MTKLSKNGEGLSLYVPRDICRIMNWNPGQEVTILPEPHNKKVIVSVYP